jgi:hypothetical protein
MLRSLPSAGFFVAGERPLLAESCHLEALTHHQLTDRLQVKSSHADGI